MAGWSKRPTSFVSVVESDVNKKLRATALQALSGVIERSPVKTGAFRGNNIVSISSPDDRYDESHVDRNGSPTLDQGMRIIGQVTDAFSVIYVQNNLPYALELENGSSIQAPEGVYDITFNNLREASR